MNATLNIGIKGESFDSYEVFNEDLLDTSWPILALPTIPLELTQPHTCSQGMATAGVQVEPGKRGFFSNGLVPGSAQWFLIDEYLGLFEEKNVGWNVLPSNSLTTQVEKFGLDGTSPAPTNTLIFTAVPEIPNVGIPILEFKSLESLFGGVEAPCV